MEQLEVRALLAANPVITEFMASNVNTLLDSDDDAPDWIEIHNADAEPIDLTGWTLTDDPGDLNRWELPARTLDSGAYLLVFASGKDWRPADDPLTRDFTATRSGTFAVDLAPGSYEVHVTIGDAVAARDEVEVYLQHNLVARRSTAAGEFAIVSGVAQVSDATNRQLEIRVTDVGGETVEAAVNALVVTPTAGGESLRFDFGEALSPVAPGYTRVTAADIYHADISYGWRRGAVSVDRDRKPHTNFKLDAGGEYLALVSPGGTVVSQFGSEASDYPPQVQDISYGATPAGNRYFMVPTPGAANGSGQTGFVADPDISMEHGFYETPFAVALTTATPDATIRYTTDGSVPTNENGILYTGPVTITGTTTLRAVALKEGLVPTKPETRTYLFPADVLHQDGTGLISAPWGHFVDGVNRPDWEVDPEIVQHPDPDSRLVVDDLLALPTVSLVMNFADMFGSMDTDGTEIDGIYNDGEGEERATSVELINPDGTEGFRTDASVQIVGGTSPTRWNSDKLSMRLKFNRQFGPGDLAYPVFGADATSSFDTLVLDAHYNNTWHHGRGDPEQHLRAQSLRDQYVADLQLAVGGYAPHGQNVHLYIDGIYWGMYWLHERPDDNFAAAYLGGNNDDYDVIKHNFGWVVHGSNDSYLRLIDAVNEDVTDPVNYQAVLDLVDVDDLIDYMLVNFYVANSDWDDQNWYATFNHTDPDGRWHYHSWDAEHVMQGLYDNATGRKSNRALGPSYMHQQLMANGEYRLRFADHVQRHFFNGGVFTTSGAATLYQKRLDEIDRAIVAESARWGDNRREPPFTRGREWINQRDWLLHEYFPQRTGIVLNQLKSAGAYPVLEAPELNQHGGPVYRTSDIELTAPEGAIYYTTDGSDPRLAGGAIAPGAVAVTGPLRLSRSSTVKARALRDGQWSALTEAAFVVMSELPLRITEINFNPHEANLVGGLDEIAADNDRFEFLELANVGTGTVDLDGVRLTETVVDGDRQGVSFTFAPQSLAAGERVVVVRDVAAFRSRYGPQARIAAGGADGAEDNQYGGKLSNHGEWLTLRDAQDHIIQQFPYGAADAWPARSRGAGSTLEVIDTAAPYSDPGNWRASAEFGGSPGWEGTGPTRGVLINEVLSRGAGADPDQIELYNPTTDPVAVSGWYLSDDARDLLKTRLPAETTLAPGGYAAVDLAAIDMDLAGTEADALWLIAADGSGRPARFVDHVDLAASDVNVAQGRWPNGDPAGSFVPMVGPSFGGPNPGPVTGSVVISEVHYHHPPLAPIFAADFSAGRAEDFTPVLGTWAVRDGGYEVTPAGKDDTVATIATDGPLPTSFVYSATMSARTVAGFNQNATLVFDYHSPTDFKYVSMLARGNKWRIGYRDANGWNVVAEEKVVQGGGIPADTAVDIMVKIDGSVAYLWTGNTYFSHDFETPLNDGQIGVGSRGGTARFEKVSLAWLGGAQDLEFIELVGTSDTPVNLEAWRLAGAVDLTFAPGTSLDQGETLVVVGFGLDLPGRGTFFREAHRIDESVPLIGPYRGNLRDTGDVVRLLKPVDLAGQGTILVPVDQAAYRPESPWPTAADGQGRALSRASATVLGQLASSWSALPPTPGTIAFAQIGDIDFNGVVDLEDVRGFARVLANPPAYQAANGVPATMVADADGDGDVDLDDIDAFVALLSGTVGSAATQPVHQRAALSPVPISLSSPALADRVVTRSAPSRRPARETGVLPAERANRRDRRRPHGSLLTGSTRMGTSMMGRHTANPARHLSGRKELASTDQTWDRLADRVMTREWVWLDRLMATGHVTL